MKLGVNYTILDILHNEHMITAEKAITEVTPKSTKMTISEDTAKGANVTLPVKYKVGTYCLDIFINGEKLIPCATYDDNTTGHYSEVGDKNTVSNTIKLTSDWNLSSGDYLEIIVRGEYV